MQKIEGVPKKRKYDIQKFAMTGGIFLAFLFLLFSLLARFTNGFSSFINLLLDFYGAIGYDLSFFGIFLGVVYGFITGYIFWTIYAKIHYWMPNKRLAK